MSETDKPFDVGEYFSEWSRAGKPEKTLTLQEQLERRINEIVAKVPESDSKSAWLAAEVERQMRWAWEQSADPGRDDDGTPTDLSLAPPGWEP